VRPVGLTLIVLSLILGGGLFWRYQRTTEGAAVTAPAPESVSGAIPADSRASIAVLPFENRSDAHEDAFFADGIHDDILTQLTKVGAMKVIARTSVEQFRDTKLTTKEIGDKLGVTRVLEGSVQRAGKRVRVTVQLVDATSDAHLWAESYDRELTAANIFAIQSEVAAAIAGALKTTLTAAERQSVNAVPTLSLDAWEAYQLGKQRMARRTSASLADAEKFFGKAIVLDPKFALAYVGLADTLRLQILYSSVPRADGLARAEQAVGTALKLDANLAEAWASSAGIAADREQYDRAETMFRHAIELNPNYAAAYQYYSRMLSDQGRAQESLSLAEHAAELDPLSAAINGNFGYELERAGRFDEARILYRKQIEIDPAMPNAYSLIGELDAYVLSRYADAVPLVEKAVELDPGGPSWGPSLAWLYLDLGDDTQAVGIIQIAEKKWPDEANVFYVSAFAHLYRGDLAAAQRDAQKLLSLEPRHEGALLLLRDADARQGHYATARARYARAYPELFTAEPPKIDRANYPIAIDLALVLQKTGETARASVLLDRIEEFIRTIPRLGGEGYLITDARIYALRGQKSEALAALRAAERAGWRSLWRYYRDFDPDLASIRDDAEFKAVFADIERDMARQRAELAARPKNMPPALN
jgi:TolB-like protein/Flp pilus assembly protein TadD